MDPDRPQDASRRAERARRMVSLCSQAAIRAYDEEALLSEACRYLVDEGGYRLAWFAESKPGQASLTSLAHAGDPGLAAEGTPPWATELGPRSPTMRALLEQRPYVVRGIPSDPLERERHPEAATIGYAALCAFPIQFGPHGAGVLTIHAREPAAFAPEEVALLRELAGDMAVGVSALRARKANEALEELLETAERRFRSIIAHAPVGVLQVDSNGRVILANLALAALVGYESPDQVLALEPEVVRQHVAPEDLERIQALLAAGPPFKAIDLEVRRVDGSTRWVQVQAKPANADSSNVIEAFVRDISMDRAAEAHRLAEERQTAEVARLQAIDRMRSQFMGRASHELNTPLTPILLQVQALQTPGLDERQARGLALVERNVLRLSGLVKDLLLASTLEAGEVDLEPTSIDVDAKLAEVVESFQEQADRAGVALVHDSNGPVRALADGARVAQVLYNLVSNALKFTPRKGTVSLRCAEQDDGSCLCTVTDTGRGFPPDQAGQLFQPFSRLHEHLPGDPGGSGLGLFISKGIAEQSGGTLWARSAGPGRGATFGLTLPAAPSLGPPPGRGIRVASGFGPLETPPAVDATSPSPVTGLAVTSAQALLDGSSA